MLRRAGGGFGMLGLAGLMQSEGLLAAPTNRTTHFPAKAKRVIFLFMNGAPSHVDTFDPKPALARHEGEQPRMPTGRTVRGGYMPSPQNYGPTCA